MNTTYLLLGGNKGDKLKNLEQAQFLLEEKLGHITKKSGLFVTAAWGNTQQPDFINQAICLETKFPAHELLINILAIEESMGRIRTEKKWEERTIDIDILFFNDVIIDTADLKIPHPFIQERKFVLVPLAQIAATFIHPKLKKNIKTLLNECSDGLPVSSYVVI